MSKTEFESDWDTKRFEAVAMGQPHGIGLRRRIMLALWHGRRCFHAPGLHGRPLLVRLGHGWYQARTAWAEPESIEALLSDMTG